MVVRAASWVSGVTPAQQVLSTEISISGKFAFSISALDTTQMSVHSPTSSTVKFYPAAAWYSSRGSKTEPKVSFSTGV